MDANLSWRLIKLLSLHFQNVQHVDRCGFQVPATDIDIWNWAKKNDFIIVTNDEDQKGFPPKVVLLRLGNQSTKNMADIIVRFKSQIAALNDREDFGILEII